MLSGTVRRLPKGVNVKHTRHCERGEAIHDLRNPGLSRHAHSDARVFMHWGGFVAMKLDESLSGGDVICEPDNCTVSDHGLSG